jgi:ribokinase
MLVVFGSLNVDMVLSVESMPQPGETVLCPDYQLFPGGKGANQAVAGARAGSHVKMFGCIGHDDFGKIACRSLEEAGVDLTGVDRHEKSTGCATICVDKNGENMIIVASGANLQAKSEFVPDSALTQDTFLLLQMEVSAEENWKLVKRAKEKGAHIILNLAPAKDIPEEVLSELSIIILNEIEVTVLSLRLGFDVISPTSAAKRIAERFGITCVVTLGSEGSYACTPTEEWSVSALDIKPVDTTAAGDCFAGVFAAGLDQGFKTEDALRRASVASGLACQSVGAQPSLPTKEAIEAALFSL